MMKKYLFIGVLALFSQTLYAQTGLNKEQLGGKSNFSAKIGTNDYSPLFYLSAILFAWLGIHR